MINSEALKEAKARYEAERSQWLALTSAGRKRIDEDAAHDVAVDMGLDPAELAEALGISGDSDGEHGRGEEK